jgi:hypothetical protein
LWDGNSRDVQPKVAAGGKARHGYFDQDDQGTTMDKPHDLIIRGPYLCGDGSQMFKKI